VSSDRTAAARGYDAVVDLGRTGDDGAFVYGLAKFTYALGGDRLHRAEAEPLLHDLRDPELDPRLPADTDFWAVKRATDVVVRGSAFAPGGRPTPRMRVSARIGAHEKQVEVFGDRPVQWTGEGRIRFGEPVPFDAMPMTWENAYGGIDWRVPTPDPERPEVAARLMTDHPGMYPRNPFGKGYLVEGGEVDEMLLPNLEDPGDLLTPGRLVTGDPRMWWNQPLPCCLDWTHPATFPRYCWMGQRVDAWFPGPQDERMPEVRRRLLPPGYRDVLAARSLDDGPHPSFKQGGSAGFVLPALEGGEPVQIVGMHPERRQVTFRLPERRPLLALAIDGEVSTPQVHLHHVVIRPDEERVNLVFRVSAPMPRVWVPGIHRHIPVAVSVDGDDWVEYDAPPPALQALADAQAESAPADDGARDAT
jgi:hypothetical protein